MGMTVAEKRARDKAAIKTFRRRNVLNGLCGCGRSVRPGISKLGGPYKTCQVCGEYQKTHHREMVREWQKVVHEPPRRDWLKLITEHDPDVVMQWRIFCDEYGDMTLSETIEEAMDLLMAITYKAEGRTHANDNETPVHALIADPVDAVAS